MDKLVTAFERAVGFGPVADYNDPATPLGPFGGWQLYQFPNGNRASASACFLSADVMTPEGGGVDGRRLTVRFQATATKVLFDDAKRAYGVRYLEDGETREAHAAKKVVVCAGLRSAQLLMLSGIGPAEVLERAGVPAVCVNEHVGRHLMDDAYTGAVFSVNGHDVAQLASSDAHAKQHGGAFFPSPDGTGAAGERSIQVIATGVTPEVLYLGVLCVNPKSRGTLEIQSDDPLKIMRGDFGFLSNDADVAVLMEALRAYIAPMAEELAAIDASYQLLSPAPTCWPTMGSWKPTCAPRSSTPTTTRARCAWAPRATPSWTDGARCTACATSWWPTRPSCRTTWTATLRRPSTLSAPRWRSTSWKKRGRRGCAALRSYERPSAKTWSVPSGFPV